MSRLPAAYDPEIYRRAKLVASILSKYGFHVSAPDEGSLDDVEKKRWEACEEIARELLLY